MKAFKGKRMNFNPPVGRTFTTLARGVFAVFEGGVDQADGMKEGAGGFLGWRHASEILAQGRWHYWEGMQPNGTKMRAVVFLAKKLDSCGIRKISLATPRT